MKKELFKKIVYYYSLGITPIAISKLTGAPIDLILKQTFGTRKKNQLTDKDKLEMISLSQRLEKR